jgi:hypothetical protein
MARRSLSAVLLSPTTVGLVLSLGLSGCGPSFDPPSELKSLRVLGVQKDKPYAQPGDEVNLQMLWHDGSEDAGRPVIRGFLSGCFNPVGDLYAGCFASLGDPSNVRFEVGDSDEFSFTIPSDIITSRPPPPDPKQPPYGLSFVFFAVCAGASLEPVEPTEEAGFPLRCLDEDRRPLGSDDFVAGYTQVYVFDEFENQNPIVTGFSFRDVDHDVDDQFTCVGEECVAEAASPVEVSNVECDAQAERCIPRCADDGEVGQCDEFPFRPLIDPESAEPDSITAAAYGRNYEEQVWVNYYATRGSVRSPVRLVNDATGGFNEDYGTKFLAPKEPGPVRLFAVVHDNRGGMSWSGTTIWVK